MSKYLIFIILGSIIPGCSAEPDFDKIDTLIREEMYKSAQKYIKSINRQAVSDSLTLKKLDHRLLLIDKGMLFRDIDSLLTLRDSSALADRMNAALLHINAQDSIKARWYWFDYYESDARFQKLFGDTNGWLSSQIRASVFPTNYPGKKVDILQNLAFHYASIHYFVEAREWMDKAVRSMDMQTEHKQLNDVYVHYMNGNYQEAKRLIISISKKLKSDNWQRFQDFLSLYADSLTMENRFRLW